MYCLYCVKHNINNIVSSSFMFVLTPRAIGSWLSQAEKTGFIKTCQAIIKVTIKVSAEGGGCLAMCHKANAGLMTHTVEFLYVHIKSFKAYIREYLQLMGVQTEFFGVFCGPLGGASV